MATFFFWVFGTIPKDNQSFWIAFTSPSPTINTPSSVYIHIPRSQDWFLPQTLFISLQPALIACGSRQSGREDGIQGWTGPVIPYTQECWGLNPWPKPYADKQHVAWYVFTQMLCIWTSAFPGWLTSWPEGGGSDILLLDTNAQKYMME